MFVAQGVSTDLSTKVDSRGEVGACGLKVPTRNCTKFQTIFGTKVDSRGGGGNLVTDFVARN